MQVVIGPARARSIAASALACGAWRVVQVSYGATNFELQKDEYYRKLFTNVPSTGSFNYARLAVMKHFGWKRVAILQEYDVKLYSSAARNFQFQATRQKNISFIASDGYQRDNSLGSNRAKTVLERLMQVGARIIIGEFSVYRAAEVFCQAYKLGMYGQKYVWFLASTSSHAWIFSPRSFERQRKNIECTLKQVVKAAEGFLIMTSVNIRQDNKTTVSGLNTHAYMAELLKRNRRGLPRTSYAFDSIWSVALMLNESLKETRPEDYELGDDTFSNNYENLLKSQSFEGMSGPHKYFRRERIGIVAISQMRNVSGTVKLVQIGIHDTSNNKLMFNEEEVKKMWKDGKVPVDQTTKERQIYTIPSAQFTIISIFSVLGLVYSLALLSFNINKRHHKVIRMSSPMINNVVLLGCSFCYVFVFLLGVDSRFVDERILGILCNVRLYVLAIAFSMAFGALFSKTWRVHKIFTAQRAIKRKMMQDSHLILFVAVLVLIDVVFISVWIAYDPLKSEDIVFKVKPSPDIIIIPVLKICNCTHMSKLLGVLYGYKGILLLFGVFLAWETRNVTTPALNDSKYIGMSVYNVVILSAIGATVSMVLNDTTYYELLHVLVSAVVLLSTTVTLTMVFLPKVHGYLMTPSESQERVRTADTLGMRVNPTTNADDVYEPYVKPKDVKHKWVQTENFDQGGEKQLA